MTAAEWLACDDPAAMVESARVRASDRKLYLFAVACCTRVWHRLADERSRHIVGVAEAFAEGVASRDDMDDATERAVDAEYDAEIESVAAAAAGAAMTLGKAWYWDVSQSVVWSLARDNPAEVWDASLYVAGRREVCDLVRCVVGDPFRPVALDPAWLTSTAVAVARAVYDARTFHDLPVLADALQDAGCDDAAVLEHCRGPGPHARGCWVVDLVLGKA